MAITRAQRNNNIDSLTDETNWPIQSEDDNTTRKGDLDYSDQNSGGAVGKLYSVTSGTPNKITSSDFDGMQILRLSGNGWTKNQGFDFDNTTNTITPTDGSIWDVGELISVQFKLPTI